MANKTTFAQGQLKSLVERIERLEEEKKTIAGDIKEVYAEAKGNGFDTKILRKVISLRKKEVSEREEEQSMLDLYMSTLSNRMNEVMKVLTIIATIFIPITFLAGVYGMNFQYMPELAWRWGYLAIWVVMIGVAGIMLFYFKKKKLL